MQTTPCAARHCCRPARQLAELLAVITGFEDRRAGLLIVETKETDDVVGARDADGLNGLHMAIIELNACLLSGRRCLERERRCLNIAIRERGYVHCARARRHSGSQLLLSLFCVGHAKRNDGGIGPRTGAEAEASRYCCQCRDTFDVIVLKGSDRLRERGQPAMEDSALLDRDFTLYKLLHAFGGQDPRTARFAPAGRTGERDLEAMLLCLIDCTVEGCFHSGVM